MEWRKWQGGKREESYVEGKARMEEGIYEERLRKKFEAIQEE